MRASDIFGQRVPDSKMAREATQLIRDYLAFMDPNFRRVDVCGLILSSPWAT